MVRVLISDPIGGSGCVPAFASKRFDPPTLFNNLAWVVDSGTAPRIASSPGDLDLLRENIRGDAEASTLNGELVYLFLDRPRKR